MDAPNSASSRKKTVKKRSAPKVAIPLPQDNSNAFLVIFVCMFIVSCCKFIVHLYLHFNCPDPYIGDAVSAIRKLVQEEPAAAQSSGFQNFDEDDLFHPSDFSCDILPRTAGGPATGMGRSYCMINNTVLHGIPVQRLLYCSQ